MDAFINPLCFLYCHQIQYQQSLSNILAEIFDVEDNTNRNPTHHHVYFP